MQYQYSLTLVLCFITEAVPKLFAISVSDTSDIQISTSLEVLTLAGRAVVMAIIGSSTLNSDIYHAPAFDRLRYCGCILKGVPFRRWLCLARSDPKQT